MRVPRGLKRGLPLVIRGGNRNSFAAPGTDKPVVVVESGERLIGAFSFGHWIRVLNRRRQIPRLPDLLVGFESGLLKLQCLRILSDRPNLGFIEPVVGDGRDLKPHL